MKMLKNDRGQSTIEFLMSIIFVVSIVFMFIGMGLNFSSGYLVQYATFMSSRAYLTADKHFLAGDLSTSDSKAQSVARAAFEEFDIESFGIHRDACPVFNEPGSKKYEYVGVYCDWKTKITLLPVIGGNQTAHMRAESFLGRIPTRLECAASVCNSMPGQESVTRCSPGSFFTLFDNGC